MPEHAPYPDNAGMLWCPVCEAPWEICPFQGDERVDD